MLKEWMKTTGLPRMRSYVHQEKGRRRRPNFRWQNCINTTRQHRWEDCLIQTRHNFVGEIRIFSVKICINPYPSFLHWCIAKTFTRFISWCSLQKKSRYCAMKIDGQQQITKIGVLSTPCGATVGLDLRLWLTRSIVLHGIRNLPFFWKFSGKSYS